MAADLNILQNPPKNSESKIVQLVPMTPSGDSKDVSWQQLETELAMMTQTILDAMVKMVKFIADQQQENSQVAQFNIGLAQSQAQGASTAYTKEIAAEKAAANEPWWKKLLDVIVKYILPIIMCVVSFIVFGPAAGLIATAVFLASAIPLHKGQSLLQITSGAIAQSIGKDCNMSPAQIQILQGCIGAVIAIAASVAGGYAATECAVTDAVDAAAAAGENAGEDAGETVAAQAAKFKTSAGRFTGINTFATTITNTNSFYDIFLGSYMEANPTADKQKAEEYAQIFALVMNIVVSLISMVGGGYSLAKGAEGAADFNSIAKALGGSVTTNIMRAVNTLQVTANLANAGSQINQAIVNKDLAQIQAALTKVLAKLKFTLGVSQQLNQNSKALTSYAKQIQAEYSSMLGHKQNLASPEFKEAKALAMNNTRA